MSGPLSYGKGDRIRPFNQQKWDENYERIFEMTYIDTRHKELQERVNSGELLSDTENDLLQRYITGRQWPEFQTFPKIPRLNRDIIITEKIDGTNAQILITEAGRVFPGSRKRWLTVEKDNFGFAAWVREHEQELLELGPGRHPGEWWGQGIQRGYGLNHKRFSLFNVSRWQSDFNSIYRLTKIEKGKEIESKRVFPPGCCQVVPILYYAPFRIDEINATLDVLRYTGSRAAPGFMNPEGIVIYHTAGNYLFKVTLENDDKPKGDNNDPKPTR